MAYDCKWRDAPGAKKLRAFFARERRKDAGWTIAKLALALGVDRSAVRFWVDGFRRPHTEAMRQAVERLTGVPSAIWPSPEERAEADRLGAA